MGLKLKTAMGLVLPSYINSPQDALEALEVLRDYCCRKSVHERLPGWRTLDTVLESAIDMIKRNLAVYLDD